MIQIVTQNPIDQMLLNPKDYINEDCDEVILKIIHNDASNPVFLLLGYDRAADCYYFTLEDNDTIEDFYCKEEHLYRVFNEIMEGKGEYEKWVKD